MKKTILISLLNVLFIALNAQQVNKFTGTFNYSIPGVEVPNPTGVGSKVSFVYSSGVRVDQASSEVGLGWGLNAGGYIERSIVANPDDFYGKTPDYVNLGFKLTSGLLRGGQELIKVNYKMDKEVRLNGVDRYYVQGVLNGELSPNIFDNNEYSFSFKEDFLGNMDSRLYPISGLPHNSNTPIYFPGDQVNGSADMYDGTDYKPGRVRTKRYVEDFSVQELSDQYSNGNTINGFINLPIDVASLASTDNGSLGGYRITDENGRVFHFTIPVYITKIVNQNFPLNHDFSDKEKFYVPDQIHREEAGKAYYVVGDAGHIIHEENSQPYAYRWLLTAVTGPDYVDVNGNQVVDAGDSGEWMSYEWVKYSGSYKSRVKNYGMETRYFAGKTKDNMDYSVDDDLSPALKFSSTSIQTKEIYYLNRILSKSHQARFFREFRMDEKEAWSGIDEWYNGGKFETRFRTINATDIPNVINAYKGAIYDDGGKSGNLGNGASASSPNIQEVTISVPNASKITFTIDEFNVSYQDDEFIEFFQGNTSTGTLIANFGYFSNGVCPSGVSCSNSIPSIGSSFTISGGLVTLRLTSRYGLDQGFKISWEADFDNSTKPKFQPLLSLSRVVLFDNGVENLSIQGGGDYLLGLSGGTHSDMDFTRNSTSLYEENWFQTHVGTLTPYILKDVELVQDYSLAKEYHKNYYMNWDDFNQAQKSMNYVNTNISLESGKSASSGKLTLTKIIPRERNRTQIYPAYLLEYNSNNNPNYDPLSKDKWGFYKSDHSSGILNSGMQTSTSKAFVDAWSLTKITDPIGKQIEIHYESNTYDRVLSSEQGNSFVGPNAILLLNSASLINSNCGTDVSINLEDNGADFSYLSSIKSNATREYYIPYTCNWTPGTSHYVSRGSSGLNGSTITGLQVYEVGYSLMGNPCSNTSCGSNNSANKLETGGGFLEFDFPIGWEMYGAGIRTNKIVVKNGPKTATTSTFSYEEGVLVHDEDGLFAPEAELIGGNLYYHPVTNSKFDNINTLGSIGYTKHSMEMVGVNNSTIGRKEYNFMVDPSGKEFMNMTRNQYVHTIGSPPSQILEDVFLYNINNAFPGYWGRLTTEESYDANNNLIQKTKYKYKNSDEIGNQGLLTDLQYEYNATDAERTLWIYRSKRVVLSEIESYTDGNHSSLLYSDFSAVNGSAKVVEKNGDLEDQGITEKMWAFEIPTYSGMGSKFDNLNNLNILNVGVEKRHKLNNDITTGNMYLSYQVSTVSDNIPELAYDAVNDEFLIDQNAVQNSFTNDKTFSFIPLRNEYGLISIGTAFDHANLLNNSNDWVLKKELQLMDAYSNVLQVKNREKVYESSKFAHSGKFVVAESANSNYASFTHSSFEDVTTQGTNQTQYAEGEVKLENGSQISIDVNGTYLPHSGKCYLEGSGDQILASYATFYNSANEEYSLIRGRKYIASVWVHSSSGNDSKLTVDLQGITGAFNASVSKSDPNNISCGDWIQMQIVFEVPSNYTPGSGDKLVINLVGDANGDSRFDDFRFSCVDCATLSATHEIETGFVSYELDNNNFASKFEYDDAGRLIATYKEIEGQGLVKIEETEYNFHRALEP